MRKPKWCRSHIDWSCDGIDCDLDYGHEGDHYASGEGKANNARADGPFVGIAFEFRWREVEVTA